MKKASAILLFTIYFLSSTEAHQLLKLPVIFQHFQEHKKESKSITLLQFLDMHYMHGSPRDADYERDMQLPFKTFGDCVSVIANAYVPVTFQIVQPRLIELPAKKIFIPQDRFTHAAYCCNIWQPPKSV